MPHVHVTRVYLPEEERLRSETYGDLEELATNLVALGQLQSILVRPFDAKEHPDTVPGVTYDWTIVDGSRRLLAVHLLLQSDRCVRGLGPGEIRYETKDYEVGDPLENLLHEFYANENRENFSWQEKARFCRSIHETLVERAEAKGGGWEVALTALYLKMSQSMLYRYLDLTEDEELFKDVEVQNALSYRTAHKKVKIKKEKARRKKQADLKAKTGGAEPDPGDYFSAALKLIDHADCREWIKQHDDESFHWIHWDPPYGGEQDGGAFSSHTGIDDSVEYASSLMDEVLPELWRTLAPGGWLVIWFHQSRREGLVNALTSLGFWVNPYECIWHKRNRTADGHDISRYLINAYEPFLLAGKPTADGELVLASSSKQNVFVHDLPSKAERRHVMHKPSALILDILRIIALPGEPGCDPSCGSGSSVKAAIRGGYPISACEIDEGYRLAAVDAAANQLKLSKAKVEAAPPPPDELTL